MGTFVVEDILSENSFTASTSNINTVRVQSVTATTFYGDGSNLTNLTNVGYQLATNIPNDAVLYNEGGSLNGTNNFIYSGDTLSFTGTSRFNGLFYRTNSPSVKAVYQWAGNINANSANPGVVWTNMPAGTTTWLHTTSTSLTGDATYITDLTEYTECRLFTSMQVAGFQASTSITVQYFNDETVSFQTLVTLTIGNTTGVKDSGWVSIPLGARIETSIRLVGAGGNGIIDPRFSPPTLLIR